MEQGEEINSAKVTFYRASFYKGRDLIAVGTKIDNVMVLTDGKNRLK